MRHEYDGVQVVIKRVNEDGELEVLLGLRRKENAWGFFGGHVEKNDETTLQTALRELKEEMCLTLESQRLDLVGSCKTIIKGGKNEFLEAIFLLTLLNSDQWEIGEPDKCIETQWLTKDRLSRFVDQGLVFEPTATVLQKFESEVWQKN